MPARDHENRQIPLVLLVAAVTLMAAVSAMANIARQAAELGPGVGDIVTFKPERPSAFSSAARLTAVRPREVSCVLDVGMIQRSGGSLVVEQRGAAENRFYRAHWAGPRTSEDATNCGAEADLVLSRTDMNTLAVAASEPDVNQPGELRLR